MRSNALHNNFLNVDRAFDELGATSHRLISADPREGSSRDLAPIFGILIEAFLADPAR